jgi:hypothetical protein
MIEDKNGKFELIRRTLNMIIPGRTESIYISEMLRLLYTCMGCADELRYPCIF